MSIEVQPELHSGPCIKSEIDPPSKDDPEEECERCQLGTRLEQAHTALVSLMPPDILKQYKVLCEEFRVAEGIKGPFDFFGYACGLPSDRETWISFIYKMRTIARKGMAPPNPHYETEKDRRNREFVTTQRDLTMNSHVTNVICTIMLPIAIKRSIEGSCVPMCSDILTTVGRKIEEEKRAAREQLALAKALASSVATARSPLGPQPRPRRTVTEDAQDDQDPRVAADD